MVSGSLRVRRERDVRRHEILDQAARLIAERGFRGVALADVAEACELTVPGVLHHFPSKSRLLLALLDRYAEEEAGHLGEATPVPADPHAFTDLMVSLALRDCANPQIVQLHTVLAAESLDPRHPAHDFFVERTETAVRRVAEMAGVWAANPTVLATQLLAAYDGLRLAWLRDPELDLPAMWRGCVQALVAGAGGRGQAPAASSRTAGATSSANRRRSPAEPTR